MPVKDEPQQDRIGLLLSPDPASGEPLARQLTRSLRHAIVTTKILPGQKLSEQELAGTLGISRQPVREAIINLRDLGLIRVLPQRGTRVTKISLRAVEDARFAREAVECALVREAARLATSAQVGALEQAVAAHREASERGDEAAAFARDDAFHRLLAETAGRPDVWETIETLKPQIDRVRYLDIHSRESALDNAGDHAGIVAAIGRGDAVAAGLIMAGHLQGLRKAVLKLRERMPEMFEGA